MLLFYMLSGKWPFTSEPGTSLIDKIIEAKFEFRSDRWQSVSKTAKDLISKILGKDAKRRPSAIELCAEEWLNDSEIVTKANELMLLLPSNDGNRNDNE